MAIVLSYDVEATGLDVNNDAVIEIGLLLWSTGQHRCLESAGFLVQTDKDITAEVTEITGITKPALDKFGYESDSAFDVFNEWAGKADLIIGHNVIRFDKRITESWAKRLGKTMPAKLWADTMTDVPNVRGEQLATMAAKHEFVNVFPHSALADCQTVVKLISKYPIEGIIERAKQPTVVIRAHQDRNNNDQAKKLKFRWNPDRKWWIKLVKQCDVDGEVKAAPFGITVEKDIPVETLWD